MKKIKQYKIIEKLGTGGMGEVYKAHDSILDRPVAIKLMHPHLHEDKVNDARFMHEARIVAKLVHPNVVTIHEVGEAENRRYIVMEFIEGASLTSIIRKEGALNPDRAINITGQILRGLQYAHSKDVLHRDIKSENIMVTDGDHVKILDFGIAKLMSQQGLTVAGDLLGTLEYMAPEQFMGEPVGPSCDIYAVGILLYQMLTSKLPFLSNSPAAILYKQLNEEPVAPSYYNDKVEPALVQVVLKAIHKDKADRWWSATEFEAALGDTLGKAPAPATLTKSESQNRPHQVVFDMDEPGQTATVTLRSVFIGRELEKKKLVSLFADALRGRGQAAVMMGEAGVGKSTLADHFTKYAKANQACVLYGACLYQDGMDAYLPFIDALRTFFHNDSYSLGEEARQHLKDAVRDKVPILLEVADRLMTVGPKVPEQTPPEPSSANLIEGFYRLIALLSTMRPVVLVIDDMQWADEATLRLFHYLSRYVASHPVFLLGISRTDRYDLQPNGKPGMLMEVLARIRREGTCEQIDINRLDRDSCDLLIDRSISPNQFTEELYESIYLETKGNPLFLTETLKQLRENGGIFNKEETWYNKRDGLELLVPNRVEDIFVRRLSGLSDEEKDILQVAAVQGHKFDPSLLSRLLETPKIVLLKVLHRIETELQIVISNEHGFQFEHPMLRELLYKDIPTALSREYHLMIANELEKIYGSDFGALVGDVAQHLRRGGDHLKALPLLCQAGMRAFGISAYREASLFYEDLLASSTQCGKPIDELVALAELHFNLGICYEETNRLQDSLKAYTEVLNFGRSNNDDKGQTDALLRIGRIHGKLGDWDSALSHYDLCIELAQQASVQNVLSRAYNNVGIIYFQKGDFELALQHFEHTLQAIDCDMGEFDKAHALTNIGIIASIRGENNVAMDNYREALEIYARKGNRQQDQARIYHNLGMAHADTDDLDAALNAFEQCLDIAYEIHDRPLQALTHLNMGKTMVRQDKLLEAKSLMEKAIKVFKRTDDTLNMAEAHLVFGLIHHGEGDFAAAEESLTRSMQLNDKLENKQGQAECYVAFAKLCYDRQDQGSAEEHFAKALQAYRRLDLQSKVEDVHKMIEESLPDSELNVTTVDTETSDENAETKRVTKVHHS